MLTMTNEASRIGARIRLFRKRAGLTQAELAHRVFVDRSYITRLEQGNNVPSWTLQIELASALGITRAELTGDEPPPPTDAEVAAQIVKEVLTGGKARWVEVYGVMDPATGFRRPSETEERYVRVLEEYLTGARDPFAVMILSNCYTGFGLIPTDHAICDRRPDRKPQDGDIVVIGSQDAVALYRWRQLDNGAELLNGDGSVARHLSDTDAVHVEGYYITVQRPPRQL